MRLRRFFCCLLAFVFILSVPFSVSASAAENYEVIPIEDYITDREVDANADLLRIEYTVPLTPYTDHYGIDTSGASVYIGSSTSTYIILNPSSTYAKHSIDTYYMGLSGGNPKLIDVDKLSRANFFNMTYDIDISFNSLNTSTRLSITDHLFKAVYLDENFEVVSGGTMSTSLQDVSISGTSTYNLTGTMNYYKPAGARYVYLMYDSGVISLMYKNGNAAITFNELKLTTDLSFSEWQEHLQTDQLEESQKQTTWLGKIWDGIINLPTKIATSIKGFFDSIVEALDNLLDGLIQGIKSLFVPSEADFVTIKDDWEALLSSRFGAVYESASIIDDWANAFSNNGTKSKVQFPSVTINLAGTTFTFGGWDVDIIPSGFQEVIASLKLITNIVCTFMFVNGMKKRLEGVLR